MGGREHNKPLNDQRTRGAAVSARARAWSIAAAVAFGAWFTANPSITRPGDGIDPRLTFGIALACIAMALLVRARWSRLLFVAAALACGVGWTSARLHHPAPDTLIAMFEEAAEDPSANPLLVRVEGIVREPPKLAPEREGLDRYLFGDRRTRFVMSADAVFAEDDRLRARGRLLVTLPTDAQMIELSVGDHVRALGLLRPVHGPMNPGEIDRRPYARQSLDAGVLVVASSRAIERVSGPTGIVDRLSSWRDTLRARAHRVVEGGGVVSAMTLGVREDDTDDVQQTFARTGVAHLLAVSGFHLGVLAWLTLGAVRLHGDHGRLAAVLAASVIVLYLVLVPAKAPIVRASAMALALLLAEVMGRRWDRLTLLGWITTALVIWRPADMLGLGLPLSVGVTALLLHLTARRHPLVFGAPKLRGFLERPSVIKNIARWFRSYAVVCVLAWMASVPLVAMKTGVISVVGPVTAMVLTPMATCTLVLGFLAVLLSMAPGPVSGWVSQIAHGCGDWMGAVVRTLDAIPGSSIEGSRVGVVWFCVALIGFVMLVRSTRWRSWTALVSVAAPCVWLIALIATSPGLPRRVALRVDMLSVGNGTCILLRSGDDAVLWDCGSLRGGLGERMLPDALRALRTAEIQTALLTHANIDHYNALPDVAERHGLKRLFVSAPSLERMRTKPGAAEVNLLGDMREHGVTVGPIAAGDTVEFGSCVLRVVWPRVGGERDGRGRVRAENDLSLVAVVEASTSAGVRRVLLTGDVQSGAIAELMELDFIGAVDVMELPHHGSWNGPSMAWVTRLGPEVVLQSTGARRVRNQSWRPAIGAIVEDGGDWHATARDGAAFVEFLEDGAVRSGAMRAGW